MSQRKTKRPPRPYYQFPWTEKAKVQALKLATLHVGSKYTTPLPYRTIAEDLFQQGFVHKLPDPATIRRLVARELGKGARR